MTYIHDYIKIKAANTIIARGKQIKLTFAGENGDTHFYRYQGSSDYMYTITAKIKPNIVTTCDCPYDGGGLCKHQVAALLRRSKEIETSPSSATAGSIDSPKRKKARATQKKSKKTTKAVKVKPNKNIISLGTDQLITPDIIAKYAERLSEYHTYYRVEVNKYEPDKILTSAHSYYDTHQSISFDRKTNKLHLKCSCRKAVDQPCIHLKLALESVIGQYGLDVFSDDFPKQVVRQVMEDYHITERATFDRLFDVGVDEMGVYVDPKHENLLPLDESTTAMLVPRIKPQPPKNQVSKAANFDFAIIIGTVEEDFGLHIPSIRVAKLKYRKGSTNYYSKYDLLPFLGDSELLDDLSTEQWQLHTRIIQLDQMVNNLSIKKYQADLVTRFLHELDQTLQAEQDRTNIFYDPEPEVRKSANLTRLTISEQHATLRFFLTETEDLFDLSVKVVVDGKAYKLSSNRIKIFPFFIIKDDTLYLYESAAVMTYVMIFLHQSSVQFIKTDYAAFHEKLIRPISDHFEVITNTVALDKSLKRTPSTFKPEVYLSEYEDTHVQLQPVANYDGKLVRAGTHSILYDDKRGRIHRDQGGETAFVEFFKSLHPAFEEQFNTYFLPAEAIVEDLWLIEAYEKLKAKDIAVLGMKDLKTFKYNVNRAHVRTSLSSDIDWFDVEVELTYGDQTVSLKDVRKAILKRQNYVQLGDGSLGLLPAEWIEKFAQYFKAGDVRKGAIRISNFQFNIIDDLYNELEVKPDFLEELYELKKRLQQLSEVEDVAQPKELNATLRSYQQEGLNWLVFLYHNKLGGCLADDMGLGKTLQVISLFAYLKEHYGDEPMTHLVIAPTSLMFNWAAEIEKFCPSLSVILYTGAYRQDYFEDLDQYDVVLTTYGRIIQDIELMQTRNFSYIVLDESQAIKNPNTKRYKAIRLLKGDHRIAMTGTPIENNTFDLYAQMNFLNPGLLGSMAHFRSEFATAIDKHRDEEASQLLRNMVQPFLLRRTKGQVANDLPPKTESIIYCDMGDAQRKVYDAYKKKYHDELLGAIEDEGIGSAQIKILEGLTKLRQLCNSTELLSDAEDYGRHSVKLDVLSEQLRQKTGQHKVLVFSQFTSMLALVKDRLNEDDIPFVYLDGKTRKRQQVVDTFQEQDDIRVFLISLKAGGVGLNLTQADYVYLIDPWWNPAVENQAIDRCYRIGQTQHVLAYRMICKDTIEEKIIQLQEHKRGVSEDIISTDGQVRSFDAEQVKMLFG